MQNQSNQKECSGGICDSKSTDKQCAGGVCDKEGQQKQDFKQTDTTKDLKQGQDIPQSNTLGQDISGIAIGQQQNQTLAGEKHLPTNNTGKQGEDVVKSEAKKW